MLEGTFKFTEVNVAPPQRNRTQLQEKDKQNVLIFVLSFRVYDTPKMVNVQKNTLIFFYAHRVKTGRLIVSMLTCTLKF